MARRLALLFALCLGLTHCVGQTGTPTTAGTPARDAGVMPCSPLDPELPAYDGTRGKELWSVFEGRRELPVAWRADDDMGTSTTATAPRRLTLTIVRTDRTSAMPDACPAEARAGVTVDIELDDGSLEVSAQSWLIGTAESATIDLVEAPVDRPDGHRVAGLIELRPDATVLSLTLEPGEVRLESLSEDPTR